MILVDTSFLIDLSRKESNPHKRAAERWLLKHSEEVLGIPTIVYGEFAEGFRNTQHPLLVQLRSHWNIIPIDWRIALSYGQISRFLRKNGQSIGSNDTWIAATAVHLKAPLLSRNVSHFSRITDLLLIKY